MRFPAVMIGMMHLLARFLLAAAMAAGPEIVDRIAATVDSEAIPESEVRKAMAVSALTPASGENAADFRSRVLDALIDQRLQFREALRFSPATPEPAQVDAAVARLRERLRSEGRDPATEFAAAGMNVDDVRAALERQIIVQNYLAERFRPIAVADEERGREEYDTHYIPERRAAGASPEPYEAIAEAMRGRSQQRMFDEEAAKWMKEIRQKAQVAIYRVDLPLPEGVPVPVPEARPIPPGPVSRRPGG
jgi:hypothetical protein